MPNFPGAIAYPLLYPVLTSQTAVQDSCFITKTAEVSLVRGSTTRDYNTHLRGAASRIDRLPERPYP